MQHPPLNLSEYAGPTLEVGQASPVPEPSEHAQWAVMFVFIFLALVIIPVLGAFGPVPGEPSAARQYLHQLLERAGTATQGQEQDRSSEVAASGTVEVPATDPFDHPALAPLKGKYCWDYMPGGTDPQAVATFQALVWNKLGRDVQTIAAERLMVCTPFEALNEQVMAAGGCKKSGCGVNDVTFYVDTAGRAALQVRADGKCQYSVEEGFSTGQSFCR